VKDPVPLTVSEPHKSEQPTPSADMSGGGEYPYPKYTWSPAGGWWAKTKNWQRKTGVALVVMAAVAAPIALFSNVNHVKFPAEERRKL
jgi:hypothetical protein